MEQRATLRRRWPHAWQPSCRCIPLCLRQIFQSSQVRNWVLKSFLKYWFWSLWQPWRTYHPLHQCSHQLHLYHLCGPFHGLYLHHQEILLLLLWQILRGKYAVKVLVWSWHLMFPVSLLNMQEGLWQWISLAIAEGRELTLTLTERHGRWH